MKYKRCPKCNLNYILLSEQICQVCRDNKADGVEDTDICPYCNKNTLDYDQVMCDSCYKKIHNKESKLPYQ